MKPEFLTTPARWTTAPRIDQTPAAYASAVERYRHRHTAADKAVWAACVIAVLALIVILALEHMA